MPLEREFMIIPILLTLIGLSLIYIEFFLPGSVFLVGGSLLLLSAVTILFIEKVSLIVIAIYALLLAIILFSLIRFALKKLRSNKEIFLHTDQSGYKASLFAKELIGQIAITSTELKPSGKIAFNDQTYEATSRENYVAKGKKIKIISGEGSRLIVKELKGD